MEKSGIELSERREGDHLQLITGSVATNLSYQPSRIDYKQAQHSNCMQYCCMLVVGVVAILALCVSIATTVIVVGFPNLTNPTVQELLTLRDELRSSPAPVTNTPAPDTTGEELQRIRETIQSSVNAISRSLENRLETIASSANAISRSLENRLNTISSSLGNNTDALERLISGMVALTTAVMSTPGRVVYTRWGNSACPDNVGTELLYSGIVGGSGATSVGGGTNYLCMPEDPEYTLADRGSTEGHATVYTTQYGLPINGVHLGDPSCAVCLVTTRSALLTIPAKTSCPSNWTKEYEGYIMTSNDASSSLYRTTFECVDRDLAIVPGSEGNTHPNAAHFWHAEGSCNAFPCPPYNANLELNCVVCTK